MFTAIYTCGPNAQPLSAKRLSSSPARRSRLAPRTACCFDDVRLLEVLDAALYYCQNNHDAARVIRRFASENPALRSELAASPRGLGLRFPPSSSYRRLSRKRLPAGRLCSRGRESVTRGGTMFPRSCGIGPWAKLRGSDRPTMKLLSILATPAWPSATADGSATG